MEFTFNDHVNVRAGPSTQTQKVEQYHPGERVRLDQYRISSDGEAWGSYIAKSGKRRYVCLGKDGESYGSFNKK